MTILKHGKFDVMAEIGLVNPTPGDRDVPSGPILN